MSNIEEIKEAELPVVSLRVFLRIYPRTPRISRLLPAFAIAGTSYLITLLIFIAISPYVKLSAPVGDPISYLTFIYLALVPFCVCVDMYTTGKKYGFAPRQGLKCFHIHKVNATTLRDILRILAAIMVVVIILFLFPSFREVLPIYAFFALFLGIFLIVLITVLPLRPLFTMTGDTLIKYCVHCINNHEPEDKEWRVRAFHAMGLAKKYYKRELRLFAYQTMNKKINLNILDTTRSKFWWIQDENFFIKLSSKLREVAECEKDSSDESVRAFATKLNELKEICVQEKEDEELLYPSKEEEMPRILAYSRLWYPLISIVLAILMLLINYFT
ncbi:MAG: hypothetical protein KJ886_04400 [Candidatus Thermoplasmatota archaeon]|nr:hypothetical protein [Candidatus Thermoplasmatota archaeon]MCG2826760.1 hypothetical protein [Thermoplasmatales archaeon]